MKRAVVTKQALLEMVHEAMFNPAFSGWSSNEEGPSEVNPVTDPSAPVSDPINPDFTPQTKVELGVAVDQLVKNLPDNEMSKIYALIKKAVDTEEAKDNDEEDMAKKTAAGGTGIEERVRRAVKDILASIDPRWNSSLTEADLPPVKKIPPGVHGGEYMRKRAKYHSDLKKYLGKADLDSPDADPVDEPEAIGEPEEGGEGEAPKRRAYKGTAIGGMTDVGGASFEQIAKELGFSVAGAKQAVDKALEKAQWLAQGIDDDDREILVLTAMNDYIKYLSKDDEITAADVQLMKDHPSIVRELDGFREFLHNAIRRQRKADQRLENPLGDAAEAPAVKPEEGGEPQLGESDGVDQSKLGIANAAATNPRVPAPKESRPGTTKAKSSATGKDIEVDWNGLESATSSKPLLSEVAAVVFADKGGPYVIADGVEARPLNPNRTQYKAGSKVNVHRRGKKGEFIVEMPNGEKWSNVNPKGHKVVAENWAAKVVARKKERPDLYCKKCLWMTGGGNCPRHGGPPWTKEREEHARARSRGEIE